ncbi:hypothetical protein FDF31_02525 [Clostridium sporogenes]|nr:hypothetical protein [Clostridium sporogenes]NFS24575.1 hypothetical protein [Clostridium sporogenes]
MEVLKPFYYDNFTCIGNKCKDSCCIGWRVFIDKKSYNKYKKVAGEFGKVLNNSMSRNRKNKSHLHYAEMKLKNKRCQLLNNNNLCDIYINLGEEYLCNTCKTYPRIVRKYGDICEKTLNLSCPEVAKIFVESNKDFNFVMQDEILNEIEGQYIEETKYNKSLYNLLWEGRSLSIDVAQFKDIEIWKRLVFIKVIEEKLQTLILESNYKESESEIDKLKNNITSYNVIQSLDSIEKINSIKVAFVSVLLQRKVNLGEHNFMFVEVLKSFNKFFKDKNDSEIEEIFNKEEEEFNKYLKKYEYVLENYIVYDLYNNYMSALKTKDLNKEILFLILKYSTIKMLLLSRWDEKNKELNNEDIIDILYSFSRVMEHDDEFIYDLYKDIKKEGYDTLAYLTILVR